MPSEHEEVAVQLDVHGHNVQITPHLRSDLERRLRHVLDGVSARVSRVTVRLHEPPRSGSGLGAQCQIVVSFRPSGGFHVRHAAPVAGDAVTRAVDELRDALGRRRVAEAWRARPSYMSME